MSDQQQQPRDLSVGYKKPPQANQFQKGRSGNPNGRPKRSKNKVPKGQGLDFGTQPANQMLLEEAYRTVTIREGEKIVQLPVIKAVFRSLGVSAMKGNRLAQATMAELVRGIEEEDRQLRSSYFETACEYKIGWQEAFDRARERGLPEPAPLPHPDDVILNMKRCEVRYAGPLTPEEKKTWDRMLEFRNELQIEVSLFADGYRRAAKSKASPVEHVKSLADRWEQYTAMYDRLNEPLSDRYRKRLENRFYPHLTHGGSTGEDK